MELEASKEIELYQPSKSIVAGAYIKDRDEVTRQAEQDLEHFWDQQAREFEWFEPWNKVLDDTDKPFYKWFVGGKTEYRL